MQTCEQEPSKEVLEAVELFNRGEWFEAHHVLDRLYMQEEKGEVRYFHQAVIQVGAALIHWQKGNFDGAMAVLERGLQHLSELRGSCQGIDVADFILGAKRLREALQALGPARMSELDPARIPKLKLVGRERPS
ncbi:DUF309 domain-containing protein [Geomonas sp. RF6]|uniref:DUF309 domain-containing protein n=1 Tax=Geomonas sp. RF6 TaxID=2897342 RepID=UPI001E3036C2|nr:DUF309 domain-containing protein [Geomonas sp. RF6]UFS71493.1 DUF309 domain-containing protein [Geomonas sp. RF6]